MNLSRRSLLKSLAALPFVGGILAAARANAKAHEADFARRYARGMTVIAENPHEDVDQCPACKHPFHLHQKPNGDWWCEVNGCSCKQRISTRRMTATEVRESQTGRTIGQCGDTLDHYRILRGGLFGACLACGESRITFPANSDCYAACRNDDEKFWVARVLRRYQPRS